MSNENIHFGNIFVVLNRAEQLSSMSLESHNAYLERLNLKFNGKLIQFSENDLAVEIWVTSHESDNWSDHKITINGNLEYFPTFLPARILTGLHEGHAIVLTSDNDTYILTACQTEYRYNRYGNFENAFNYVTQNIA